jgi:hypothetical protein
MFNKISSKEQGSYALHNRDRMPYSAAKEGQLYPTGLGRRTRQAVVRFQYCTSQRKYYRIAHRITCTIASLEVAIC